MFQTTNQSCCHCLLSGSIWWFSCGVYRLSMPNCLERSKERSRSQVGVPRKYELLRTVQMPILNSPSVPEVRALNILMNSNVHTSHMHPKELEFRLHVCMCITIPCCIIIPPRNMCPGNLSGPYDPGDITPCTIICGGSTFAGAAPSACCCAQYLQTWL